MNRPEKSDGSRLVIFECMGQSLHNISRNCLKSIVWEDISLSELSVHVIQVRFDGLSSVGNEGLDAAFASECALEDLPAACIPLI